MTDKLIFVGSSEEKVAFSAHILGNKAVSLTGGSIVVYDQILTNLGNGYNKNSGSFTVPVAGTYFFTIYFMTASTSSSHLGIYVNGESKCTSRAGADYGVSTCSIIEELNVGDVVNVKVFHPSSSAKLYGSSTYYKHQHGFVGLLYKKA